MIPFTLDDLDKELKRRNQALANLVDYTDRRSSAYRLAIGDYQTKLISAADAFIKKNTFSLSTPPSTGTQKFNTTVGDFFVTAMEADAESIDGNTIFVGIASGALEDCLRMTPDAIVLAGATPTKLAFYEQKGQLMIYMKDAEVTVPAVVHYHYFRTLATDLSGGSSTALDIKSDGFNAVVTSTYQYMLEAV
jgi:hypothetical protein